MGAFCRSRGGRVDAVHPTVCYAIRTRVRRFDLTCTLAKRVLVEMTRQGGTGPPLFHPWTEAGTGRASEVAAAVDVDVDDQWQPWTELPPGNCVWHVAEDRQVAEVVAMRSCGPGPLDGSARAGAVGTSVVVLDERSEASRDLRGPAGAAQRRGHRQAGRGCAAPRWAATCPLVLRGRPRRRGMSPPPERRVVRAAPRPRGARAARRSAPAPALMVFTRYPRTPAGRHHPVTRRAAAGLQHMPTTCGPSMNSTITPVPQVASTTPDERRSSHAF